MIDNKELAYIMYRGAFGKEAPRLMETDPYYEPYLEYLLKCAFEGKEATDEEIEAIYGDYDLVIHKDGDEEREFAKEFAKEQKERKQG